MVQDKQLGTVFKRVKSCALILHQPVVSHLNGKDLGDVGALTRSRMNGLPPFESTIEQTTKTMPLSHKTKTVVAIMTNRFTSLGELLHY